MSGKMVLWDLNSPFSWSIGFLNEVPTPCPQQVSLDLLACHAARNTNTCLNGLFLSQFSSVWSTADFQLDKSITLFTIAKTWKQSKCPSTDEWIKKKWYTSTMEYYSAIKKNKIMPSVATWMELETLTLSEVRSRKTNTIWYHFYLESNKRHKWRKETKLMAWRTDVWLSRGRGK